MATQEELQEFIDTKFPPNQELKVTPFKQFFSLIVNFLKDSIPKNLNNLVSAIFGTTDISNKTIKDLVNNQSFQGTSLVDYIKYSSSVKSYTNLNSLLNEPKKELELLRVLQIDVGEPVIYMYNRITQGFTKLNDQFLKLNEYTTNGKIRADKIDVYINLVSEDQSLLIEETPGQTNIESNTSFITQEFDSVSGGLIILDFDAIQILGIYNDGIRLNSTEYNLITEKMVSFNNPVNFIVIDYLHLKTD